MGEDLEDCGEVAEENAFDAVEVVVFDVVSEAAEVFEHFAGDAFGADVFGADPWVEIGEGVEGAVDEIAAGFGVFEVFESGETFFEGDPVGFHLLHGLGFGFGELAAEDDVRVFGDGFAECEDVCGESGGIRVEEGEGIDEIERERVVEGEVVLETDVDLELACGSAFGFREDADDAAICEGAEELPCALAVGGFGGCGVVAVADEFLEGAAAVGVAAEDLEDDAVGDLELGGERFRGSGLEFGEGFGAPADEAGGWFFLDDFAELFGIAAGAGFEFGVFDDVFRGLGGDIADGVEAAAAGAAGDLVEVAGAEDADLGAVVFGETC